MQSVKHTGTAVTRNRLRRTASQGMDQILERERGALTFELHADVEALLEPAEGTPLPLGLVDVTAALGHARVDLLVLHSPLEEALAGLAREQAVVVAGHLVAAHGAQLLDHVLGVGEVRGPGYRARDDAHADLARQARVAHGGRARLALPVGAAAAVGRAAAAAAAAGRGRAAAAGRVAVGRGRAHRVAGRLQAGARAGAPGRGSGAVAPGAAAAAAAATCRREQTRVHLLAAAGRVVAPEEALAVLAAEQPELEAGHFVAAHGAALLEARGVEERGLEAGHAARAARLGLAALRVLGERAGVLGLRLLGGVAHGGAGGALALGAVAVARGAVLVAVLLRGLLLARGLLARAAGALRTALGAQVERRHVQGYEA